MNELQIFNDVESEELYQFEKSLKRYCGVIYGVEFGNRLKIGKTLMPYRRMKALNRIAMYCGEKLGRVAVSVPHTNFSKNETKIHEIFSYARIKGTELFALSMDDFLTTLRTIDFEFLDDSKQFAEEAKRFIDTMKQLILLDRPIYNAEHCLDKIEEIMEQAILDITLSLDRIEAAMKQKITKVQFTTLAYVLDVSSHTMLNLGYSLTDVNTIKQAVLNSFRYSPDDFMDLKDLYGIE